MWHSERQSKTGFEAARTPRQRVTVINNLLLHFVVFGCRKTSCSVGVHSGSIVRLRLPRRAKTFSGCQVSSLSVLSFALCFMCALGWLVGDAASSRLWCQVNVKKLQSTNCQPVSRSIDVSQSVRQVGWLEPVWLVVDKVCLEARQTSGVNAQIKSLAFSLHSFSLSRALYLSTIYKDE